MTSEEFSNISSSIPQQPGVYKYFSKDGELLYVGKAKNLRKRVSSYFSKQQSSYKTKELVHRIARIEFTIVDSEADAFLLENQLIKQNQPFYNISLKDDKTYPYIVVKNENFPRVFFTRKRLHDSSRYFGPYTSVFKVRELLDFLKSQIPLRTCKLPLTPKNIAAGKFKVCLEYHLGNCKGPCEGYQSKEDYDQGIEQIVSILKGNLGPVIHYYKEQIQEYSKNLEFEKAAQIHQRLQNLMDYQAKSVVVQHAVGKMDVFSILEEGNLAYVNYLHVNNGAIIHTQTLQLEKKLEETAEEVLVHAIAQIRARFESDAPEIIVPFAINYPDEKIKITTPSGGNKKNLLQLSIKNVNHYRSDLALKKVLRLEEKTSEEKMKVLKQLQHDLRLNQLPTHIECFDNSNVQGHHPVAGMVCFINGMPAKDRYRKFKIKTVVGINDFASMKEVVHRRYRALLEEDGSFPQLVIIDGGKGQLNAALESIEALGLKGKMTVVGLAKNKEEIFFPNDQESLLLPWDSESLKLIRRIRDEVHRFAITFHRQLRSKNAINNTLMNIEGIGPKTAELLLKTFRSVQNIAETDEATLAAVVGNAKAKLIKQALQHPEK